MEHMPEEIGKIIDFAKKLLVNYYENLDGSPMSQSAKGFEQASSLESTLRITEKPTNSLEDLLSIFFTTVVPNSLNTASGGYLGFIPGGGLFLSALADFLVLATNRYAGVNFTAPLLSQMEVTVLKWFAEFLGFPQETAGGILTSGGSIANLTAIIVARDKMLREEEYHKGVIYLSEQTHLSCEKAAHAAGIPRANIRKISVNEKLELDCGQLSRQIKADILLGLVPFFVVGNAGTTDCGAVDSFHKIFLIAQEHGLWFHIDAAYGGFFALTPKGKQVLSGIELADSVTLDPHKGLFLPYGTGALVVKNKMDLRHAFDVRAGYISDTVDEDVFWDFSHTSLEMSRAARGFRILLPLLQFGSAHFCTLLEEKMDLAKKTYHKISLDPKFMLLQEPSLSLFAFRLKEMPSRNKDMSDINSINKALLAKINAKQKVFISGTTIHGLYFLRVAILSYRTHMEHMEMFWENLQESCRELGY